MGLQFISAQSVSANAFTISSISETASVGTPIVGYTLTSFNPGSVYTISPNVGNGLNFNIVTGTLTGTPIAAAALVSYTITEMSPGFPTQTYDVTVNSATSPLFLLSSSSEVATAGSPIAGYTISPLGTAAVSYAILPAVSPGLAFNTNTGLLSGTPSSAHALVSYTVTATDGAANTAFQTFDLTVNAFVPTTPAFTLTSGSESVTTGNSIVGYSIISTGDAITSYSINPSVTGTGLSFSTVTGLLTGAPLTVAAGNSYTITARDAAAHAASQNFILLVSLPVPIFPAFTLSHSTESATSGTPIVGYTVNSTGDAITSFTLSPAISNGLIFNSTTGIISGTPGVAAANITYTITAHDAAANTFGRTFDLLVLLPAISIPDPAQRDKIINVYPTFIQHRVPNPRVTFLGVFPQLITGVQVNNINIPDSAFVNVSSTMVVVTIPSQPTGNCDIQLFDGAVPLLTIQRIEVRDPEADLLTIDQSSIGPVTINSGTEFVHHVKRLGGAPDVTFAVTGGKLPPGLSIDRLTGVISGVPTGGGSTFTVTVSDTLGQSANAEITIIVKPTLLVFDTPNVTLHVVAGSPNSTYRPKVSGGLAPYSFASNLLPTGFELANDGFSIPSASFTPGTRTLTFQVTDSLGATASQTVNVVISDSLIITSPKSNQILKGTVGVKSSLAIQHIGGMGLITYQVTSGELPLGLTLEVDGYIAGTPKSAGTSTFTITAQDSSTPTQSYSVTGIKYRIAASWTDQKTAGFQQWHSITSSSDGSHLAAVVLHGDIWTSADSGKTWIDHKSAGAHSWYAIASNSDGTRLAAGIAGGGIWTSSDSGETWKELLVVGAREWYSVASSSDGARLAAVDAGGYIYTSRDSGTTWRVHKELDRGNWNSIASSSDGTHLAAVIYGGDIWTSADSGAHWTDQSDAQSRDWYSIASSSDGMSLAAVVIDGDIWTSSDGGRSWTDRKSAGPRQWFLITSSGDGTHLAAVVSGGDIWTSVNSGRSWRDQKAAGSRAWYSIASSADGTFLAAAPAGGDIWTK